VEDKMSDKTKIEWSDATWNPVTGCTEVSPGCDHCYAKTFAERWRGTPGHYFERGFDVQLRPDKLDLPLRWRKPKRIFVNSMSDLFHDQVPDMYIAQVFAVMALAPRHTFQLLTKRHGRMRSLLNDDQFVRRVWNECDGIRPREQHPDVMEWPLPNVWLGVSTENQQWADIRIPALLDTPAAVRFISAEPLLGAIDLAGYLRCPNPDLCGPGPCSSCACPDNAKYDDREVWSTNAIDWVIVGGESGPGARPMHPWWAESLHRQCETAGVPFLFKQWGEWTPLAPIVDGKYDFSRGITMTDDGNTYNRGDLDYPDGPRRGEAQRADFPYHHPTSMYRIGKQRAGRELYHDGRTWDEYPGVVANV
jgi:protein gp37